MYNEFEVKKKVYIVKKKKKRKVQVSTLLLQNL